MTGLSIGAAMMRWSLKDSARTHGMRKVSGTVIHASHEPDLADKSNMLKLTFICCDQITEPIENRKTFPHLDGDPSALEEFLASPGARMQGL